MAGGILLKAIIKWSGTSFAGMPYDWGSVDGFSTFCQKVIIWNKKSLFDPTILCLTYCGN